MSEKKDTLPTSNPSAVLAREDLYLPDRFESLRHAGEDALRAIVHPVEAALRSLDARFAEMRVARRGGLMILRGASGAGKSTFLDTVGLFRKSIVTIRVPGGVDVEAMLEVIGGSDRPRIVVLEGREALRTEPPEAIEASLHAVNRFVRSRVGAETLVVWPTNTDDLTAILTMVAGQLGAEALFGVGEPVHHFTGPPQAAFVRIAEQTVQALNGGASLMAMGISVGHAREMAARATTIGQFMALIREMSLANGAHVAELLKTERYRLWTLVIAGNEPEHHVAALTRGSQGFVDIDRLLSVTDANVVKELKKHSDKLGFLGTNLDARIVHMDMLTALAVVREYGNDRLQEMMRGSRIATKPSRTASARARLAGSELGRLLAADALGTRRGGGSRAGGRTTSAFAALMEIAKANDGLLNRAIGDGLTSAGLVESCETEKDIGGDLRFASDLYLIRVGEPVRIEVMWRTRATQAEIANYALTKLHNYGRTIGYLP